MECVVCSRGFSAKLPFFCVACARNFLYEPRLDAARILLEKDRLGKRIETAVSSDPVIGGAKDDVSQALAHTWSVEMLGLQRAESDQKTKALQDHIEILRDEIKNAREEIQKRKTKLAGRRSEMKSIQGVLPDRRQRLENSIEEPIKKGRQSWDLVHKRTAETRSFLCKEAALLYRLRQKKRMRGGVMKDHYSIGGVPIVNLRDINSMKSNELSTSISHVAHLLVLVSFYLSIRLPAEITLPHRGYPLPTIFTPANSYSTPEVPFPGTTPTPSLTTSPSMSRHGDLRPSRRPRPLFIEPENMDEKIPQIAKRDPAAFSFFVEGISLLAWNVAWVCRSQGMHTGTETWEDTCDIGKNLWQLLLAPPQSSALMRALSTRDIQGSQKTNIEGATKTPARAKSLPRLGQYSHASAHSFLGGPEAHDSLRRWKLAKYTMVGDPLKKALLGEMNNAEWELLEEQEWDDGGERLNGDDAVLIKTRAMDGRQYDDARSVMTARSRIGDVGDGEESSGPTRAKGTSGWTKVKSREK